MPGERAPLPLRERITVTVDDFIQLTGISRRRVYEMIKAGKLKSLRVCTRRLIAVQPYIAHVERGEDIDVPRTVHTRPEEIVGTGGGSNGNGRARH